MKKQANLRTRPIKRVVAIGDSITYGACATHESKRWVNLTVRMLEEAQGSGIELINKGISANVLTPECPSYEYSGNLAGLERVDSDVILLDPDMVFIAYGLNDSRGGTGPEVFKEEYQKLIDRIQAKINPVIVLVNTYYMHEEFYKNCEHWDKSDYDTTDIYNLIIKQLSEKNNLIYADIYSAQVGVDWSVGSDHCHPNDLGHRLIANRVFEAIARKCSFTAQNDSNNSIYGG